MQTVKTLSKLLCGFRNDVPVILRVEGIDYEMGATVCVEDGVLIIAPQYRYADDGITPEPVLFLPASTPCRI